MAIKPRYVFPLNFRAEDKVILDEAIRISEERRVDLTSIMREALKRFTEAEGEKSISPKMDDFLGYSLRNGMDPAYRKVLTPADLKVIIDSDVLRFAKLVRGRKQELEAELRRRGYHFVW